jgi:hypothetical protein
MLSANPSHPFRKFLPHFPPTLQKLRSFCAKNFGFPQWKVSLFRAYYW